MLPLIVRLLSTLAWAAGPVPEHYPDAGLLNALAPLLINADEVRAMMNQHGGEDIIAALIDARHSVALKIRTPCRAMLQPIPAMAKALQQDLLSPRPVRARRRAAARALAAAEATENDKLNALGEVLLGSHERGRIGELLAATAVPGLMTVNASKRTILRRIVGPGRAAVIAAEPMFATMLKRRWKEYDLIFAEGRAIGEVKFIRWNLGPLTNVLPQLEAQARQLAEVVGGLQRQGFPIEGHYIFVGELPPEDVWRALTDLDLQVSFIPLRP